MKLMWLLLTILITTFTSCSRRKIVASYTESQIKDSSSFYIVNKIDSINNYYLIYAKRNDSIFKIVSKKTVALACAKITINKKYNFSLTSLWTKPIMMGSLNVSPSQTPHVTGMSLNDSTVIKINRANGINDLFSSSNLDGLCYIKQ